MLIKTQDELSVISLEKMQCISIEKKDKRTFIVGKCENKAYILGEYSSIKIAKKILNNLLRDYKEIYFDSENKSWYIVYEMPSYQ